MKLKTLAYFLFLFFLVACTSKKEVDVQKTTDNKMEKPTEANDKKDFKWVTEQFADLRILRYQVPGFEQLSLKQKKLVYYLTQAGLSGRDIFWDQNYRHNLTIRHALEKIIKTYSGDKTTDDWKKFMVYTKRVMFSCGIHHHYSMDKIMPDFSKDYFKKIASASNVSLSDEVLEAMFNPAIDNKKVNLDPKKGLVKGSAVNFYDPDITEAEVDAFYKKQKAAAKDKKLSFGLNSKLVRNAKGQIEEQVYSVNGLYGPAIKKIIGWLEKAVSVAENPKQAEALKLLIKYYQTGDLATWDAYNIAWVETTEGDIDYINSFIEVYDDPKGYKASYESIVELTDFDASKRMAVLSDNIQWFEDHSPTLKKHKKQNVKGVIYKVVNVAGLAGATSPSSPIGVNLPNANWIRAAHGSKSVSLGNLIAAYDEASGEGMLKLFANDEEEIQRSMKYGVLADKMSTALHEVLGHASGKIEDGVGTPKETLKSYASTMEEARADIFALYYIMDPKLIELGLMPNKEAAKAEYDNYISNGMLKQLRRLEMGKDIEEAHMRNRALIANWAFEKGRKDNVIEKNIRNGFIYYNINDYDKLRDLFGQLLKEMQRIKSQGDYNAARDLVENYGVKVEPKVHQEVLDRVKELHIAPYSGFLNPRLVPTKDGDGNITDIKVEYPDDFMNQMLEYGERFGFLGNSK